MKKATTDIHEYSARTAAVRIGASVIYSAVTVLLVSFIVGVLVTSLVAGASPGFSFNLALSLVASCFGSAVGSPWGIGGLLGIVAVICVDVYFRLKGDYRPF